jgi:hypothetical protein
LQAAGRQGGGIHNREKVLSTYYSDATQHAERYLKILLQTGAKSITIRYNIFVYNSKRQRTSFPRVLQKTAGRQELIVSLGFSICSVISCKIN